MSADLYVVYLMALLGEAAVEAPTSAPVLIAYRIGEIDRTKGAAPCDRATLENAVQSLDGTTRSAEYGVVWNYLVVNPMPRDDAGNHARATWLSRAVAVLGAPPESTKDGAS